MTRFYIEIQKLDGAREFYDYTCETSHQASTYAREKAALHAGRVAVCRPARDQRGTKR